MLPLDGAKVEIRAEVGEENIFIYSLKTFEVAYLKAKSYNSLDYYNANPEFKHVIDLIAQGRFSPEKKDLFRPIIDSLSYQGEHYCLLADFDAYINCLQWVAEVYQDQPSWTKMSILNVANMGKFSSDRTIQQ